MHRGRNNRPVVTGKPRALGGSAGRAEATGLGVFFAAERFLEVAPPAGLATLEGARVCVQGFGNVGSVAARAFAKAGARIVAISDSQGGIMHPDGIDLDAAAAHRAERGSVVGLTQTTTITNEDLVTLDCDILIPAAIANQVTQANAEAVRAKLVVEGANAPVTPAADDILTARGIPVLPDILANAGGLTVSYFEWEQNTENEEWEYDAVIARLRQRMRRAVDRLAAGLAGPEDEADTEFTGGPAMPVLDKPLDLRATALIIAVRRVARATLQRGMWP